MYDYVLVGKCLVASVYRSATLMTASHVMSTTVWTCGFLMRRNINRWLFGSSYSGLRNCSGFWGLCW